MRKIIDRSTQRQGSWREVDVARSESGVRRGKNSEEECMDSGYAKVEEGVGGVLMYTSSRPGV